jgi:hypothetical protein
VIGPQARPSTQATSYRPYWRQWRRYNPFSQTGLRGADVRAEKSSFNKERNKDRPTVSAGPQIICFGEQLGRSSAA